MLKTNVCTWSGSLLSRVGSTWFGAPEQALQTQVIHITPVQGNSSTVFFPLMLTNTDLFFSFLSSVPVLQWLGVVHREYCRSVRDCHSSSWGETGKHTCVPHKSVLWKCSAEETDSFRFLEATWCQCQFHLLHLLIVSLFIKQKCQPFSCSRFSSVRICCFSIFYHCKSFGFGLLARRNKTSEDVTSGPERLTGIFHSFVTYEIN